MMIRVMYSDGRFDIVKPKLLEDLIEQEVVTSFKRSTGWVVVGRDPIRNSGITDYGGAERRVDNNNPGHNRNQFPASQT